MNSTSVELSGEDAARVFGENLGDDDRRQAHKWLLHLAWPHYNRALAAERSGQIPKALIEAQSAARYGPYTPRVLKSAFLIAAKHGAFGFAQRLLNQIRDLGLEEESDYTSLLRRRVERWNQFLGDTAMLRRTYQQCEVTPSYRELLLLAERVGSVPTEIEQAHLSAHGIVAGRNETTQNEAAASKTGSSLSVPTTRLILGLVAACLVGILLGGGVSYLDRDAGELASNSASATLSAVPDSLVHVKRYEASIQVGGLLAEGQPVQAYRALDQLSTDSAHTEALDSLRAATHRALYRAGIRAWDAEDYEQVVQTLSLIRNVSVGESQTKLYALGVAAMQIGESDLSVDVLQDLMPKIDARHPHYKAQAAYLLVAHGPPNVARRYAKLIADQYDDTLYNNSVVRARLDDS